MDALCHLSLASTEVDTTPLHTENLPPTALERLALIGHLTGGKLPKCTASLLCLNGLDLAYCKLTEDPFAILQTLPNLMYLNLNGASYVGKKLGKCRARGFPKLQWLNLYNLNELRKWGNVEEGAMPCLRRLFVWNCRKLRRLPQGFQYFTTLQQLNLFLMSDEFVSRAKRDWPPY
ncbi:hypothetical protein AMTR_s00044p00195990 [Amborella trichopoda]|uniref:Uncharacterized protein n=1 Tax=Amborella trichopoda TaxID=13333 RepID=U5D744_AMBTC|nr:hypothetical protein AMTR_s00044p00195990 [Amborella trichopoda]